MVKKKNNGLKHFLVFVLVVLMILAIIFVIVKVIQNPDRYNYDGMNGEYVISKEKVFDIDIYNIHIFSDNNEYLYPFRNHPKDLENLEFEDDLSSKLNRPDSIRVLYVTRNYDLNAMTGGYDIVASAPANQILGAGEVGLFKLNLVNTYTSFVRDELPVINCGNVSSDVAVIYYKLGEETRVYSDENECIVIEGESADGLVKAGEKFAYYILGVF